MARVLNARPHAGLCPIIYFTEPVIILFHASATKISDDGFQPPEVLKGAVAILLGGLCLQGVGLGFFKNSTALENVFGGLFIP